MEHLTQEEIERRKYLIRRIKRRKRRRRVIIARIIAAVVGLLMIAGLVFLASMGIGYIIKSNDSSNIKATQAPTKRPEVIIPDGYEDIYNKLLVLKRTYPDVNDIIMNLTQYPRKILDLFIDNQETLSFVLNYPKHKNDIASSGELSDEEVSSGIPSLRQWDGRWGYVKYGNDILAISGCGPTCMAMVYSGLLKNISMSPADMAEYCTDKGYYSQDAGTSWNMMLEGAKDLGLVAEKISLNSIKKALSENKPVICSMAPGDFTDTGHFIVLVGIDEKGRIIVNDPNSTARSEKHWKLGKIQKQAKAAWAYSVNFTN